MTLGRLRRGDVLAAVAALALLFFMAMDWYTDKVGEDARRTERLAKPRGATAGEITRQLRDDARISAEQRESNAWQADRAVDRILLVVLLAAAALALLAAAARVAGKGSRRALSPSLLAATAGALGAVLVAYRIVQEPGLDAATVVKAGAPLALLALVLLSAGAADAARSEDAEADSAAEADGEPPAVAA